MRGGTYGRYLPGGHLIYINRGTLFAVPFDVDRLEIRGTPAPVLDQVGYSTLKRLRTVRFLPRRNADLPQRRSGGRQSGHRAVAGCGWQNTATSGKTMFAISGYAFRRMDSVWHWTTVALIRVYEARRDTMTRLTFGGGTNIAPVWTPDSRYIVFNGPGGGIWWARSDGAGKPQQLTQGKTGDIPFSSHPMESGWVSSN